MSLPLRTPPRPRGFPERHAVLYLIGSFRQGGAEKHLVDLLELLDRNRVRPSVACFREGGGLFERVATLDLELDVLGLRAPLIRSGNLARIMRCARRLRKRGIELIHSYLVEANIVGAVLSLLSGVPLVASLRSEDSLKSWRLMRAHLWALRRARGIVCVSEAVRRAYVVRGVDAERMVVIENGVQMPRPHLSKRDARARLGVDPETLLIVSVGSLGPEKDHLSLIAAAERVCARIPRARFFIAGDGPLRGTLERAIHARGLQGRVELLGHLPSVAPVLYGADVFCLSSVVEGMSNALLEAMIVGLPCVATDVGANREVLADGAAGVIVPPRDPTALAEALCCLGEDAARRKSLGALAHERARRQYTPERTVRAVEAYYARVLQGRG